MASVKFARSGFAQAGATQSHHCQLSLKVTVGGVDRTLNFKKDNWSLNQNLNATPDVLRCIVRGFTPTELQEVKLHFCADDNLLFGGHVMDVEDVTPREGLRWVRHQLQISDYTWLMDRYSPVNRHYFTRPVNEIVADLLARFTDPASNFRVGSCPDTLGNLSTTFTNETVSGALTRIARAIDGAWYGDPMRCVHVFSSTLPVAQNAAINNTDATFSELRYRRTASQLRNFIQITGTGSTVAALVPTQSTTCPLVNADAFNNGAGAAWTGTYFFLYTGKSGHTLTGCTLIQDDIPQGAEVRVFTSVQDTASQIAIAAILGGGQDGGIRDAVVDTGLTESEATEFANGELVLFKDVLETIEFSTWRIFGLIPGSIITPTLTSPRSITGTFPIHSITLRPRRMKGGTIVEFDRQITATKSMRLLTGLLRVLN